MTSKRLLSLLLFTMFIPLAACGDDEPVEFVYDSKSYFVKDYASTYTKVDEFNCTKSSTHSGNYVRVYFDAKANYASAEAAEEGAVVVKPQYKDTGCSELAAITVMRKKATAENGWEWQQVNADGTIGGEGQIEFCVNCHKGTCADDLLCGN